MRVVFFLFLLLLPLPLAIYAEDLGKLSANPVGLSGSSGSFGFPIRQPNEGDKLNKPNKRNEPVWSLPTAAACELKDGDPAAEPLHMISELVDTLILHRSSRACCHSQAREESGKRLPVHFLCFRTGHSRREHW